MAAPNDHNTDWVSVKNNLSSFTAKCGISIEETNKPHVIQDTMQTWLCSKWNVTMLGELVGNKMVKFRIGPQRIRNGTVLWENLCSYEEATLRDFDEWCNSTTDRALPKENPLGKYDRDKFWCYADYKYMRDLFKNQPQAFEAIPWESLGLTGFNGEDSTIWIGSKGAHTVCHQDSYGFNVVAQIQGRKRWYLFPPEQADCLYPSRLPYEESSTFSGVNVTKPDLAKNPRLRDATPHVVVLQPGDILYVPRHWWHYVECIDTSVSVNCWVELESDHLSRLHESVTRMLIYRLLHNREQDDLIPDWLNPTETLTSHETNLLYLETSLKVVKQLCDQRTTGSEPFCSNSPDQREPSRSENYRPGKRKLDPSEQVCSQGERRRKAGHSEDEKDEDERDEDERDEDGLIKKSLSKRTHYANKSGGGNNGGEHPKMKVSRVPSLPINEIITEDTGEDSLKGKERDEGIMEVLAKCVTDPRVVSMVTDLLLERLKNR